MGNVEKSGEADKPNIQGEGDYDAARRYRKEVKDYLDTADVDKAAHEAAPKSSDEQREMDEAERAGRKHSKGGKEKPMGTQPENKKTQQ
jgi:hypothetical protein